MNLLRIGAAAAALVAFAGTSALAAQKTVTVPIMSQNSSGESGTATLTPTPQGVKIVIALGHAPADAQPSHIHAGTCSNLTKAPTYPLSNVVDGKSTTMLKDVKMSDLLGGKYAINVHKSTSDLGTYVACGGIQ